MPAFSAPVSLQTNTESASINTLATGRGRRSCPRQNMESENMCLSTSLGNLHCLNIQRRSTASRCRQIVAGPSMAHLAASQTQQQMQSRGGLSDITNLAENGYQNVKGKLSTGQCLKRPSDALQSGTTAHATRHAPAPGMCSGRLPARPVAPPPPQTLMPLEVISPVPAEIGSPEQHRRNPQECKEYEAEIVAGLFAEERLHMPRPDYMASQPDLNGKMRAILLDWLVEVHMKYKLRRETLYLAVSIIDRYLAVQPVPRNRLQLVGVVGMFVAAKVEQINPPQVADFVYITDNTYTKEEVLSMECTMLSALSFSIAVPTQAHFLDYLLKANQCDTEEHRALVDYLLELALVDVRMIRHEPSKVVSSALLLSNEVMGRPVWPERMVQISRYADATLRGCVEELRSLLRAAPSGTLQAVRKKYVLQQYCSIARLPEVLQA
eukprot:TRINITY_DN10391_c0_g5_i1.p1 TRINITY_DN10391_c0_g5~~TRINITY_DN10391_c0_g5_i1.p1  ORF type:complete len:438 (-),score=74.45 TRINITY_DN10391_c0_g5_i1:197-1510(-)